MRGFGVLPVAIVAATMSAGAWGDSITIDGATHDDVLVRESSSMYYVQFPTGELRSFPKSAGTVSGVAISTGAAERDRLHAAWQAARGNEVPGSDATREERFPLATAAVREAIEKSNEPVVLRLKGTKKPAQSPRAVPETVPAELFVGDHMFTMNLNRERLANVLETRVTEQPAGARVHNGTLRLTRPLPRDSRLQTRHYNVANASGTLPKIVVQNPGGAGGGGGFGGGQGGGAAGGFGGGGAAGGFGGAGLAGPQIQNISQLFNTIDDRLVGERLNPISAMYGVR